MTIFYPSGSGMTKADIVEKINDVAEYCEIDFEATEDDLSDKICQRFVNELQWIEESHQDEDYCAYVVREFIKRLIVNVLM